MCSLCGISLTYYSIWWKIRNIWLQILSTADIKMCYYCANTGKEELESKRCQCGLRQHQASFKNHCALKIRAQMYTACTCTVHALFKFCSCTIRALLCLNTWEARQVKVKYCTSVPESCLWRKHLLDGQVSQHLCLTWTHFFCYQALAFAKFISQGIFWCIHLLSKHWITSTFHSTPQRSSQPERPNSELKQHRESEKKKVV